MKVLEHFSVTRQVATRQSLALSELCQLSQTIPLFHMKRMLHERTPITRSESQHNERRVSEDQSLCFGGEIYDRQDGPKIAKKWDLGSFVYFFAIFRPFFPPLRGPFSIFGQCFPICGSKSLLENRGFFGGFFPALFPRKMAVKIHEKNPPRKPKTKVHE